MTEQEWLVCEDPRAMCAEMTNRISSLSDRRWRLLACAIQRSRFVYIRNEPEFEEAIKVATAWAETGKRPSENVNNYCVLMEPAYRGIGWLINEPRDAPPESVIRDVGMDRIASDLFREVIGNPFRPLQLPDCILQRTACDCCNGSKRVFIDGSSACKHCNKRGWFTVQGKVLSHIAEIAQQIYDTQDYAGMPILADAMEEAGCKEQIKCKRCKGTKWIHRRTPDDEGFGRMTVTDPCPDCRATGMVCNPILEHLRGNNTHVRGCWALDLILGKE